jgi:hypothetical protein
MIPFVGVFLNLIPMKVWILLIAIVGGMTWWTGKIPILGYEVFSKDKKEKKEDKEKFCGSSCSL